MVLMRHSKLIIDSDPEILQVNLHVEVLFDTSEPRHQCHSFMVMGNHIHQTMKALIIISTAFVSLTFIDVGSMDELQPRVVTLEHW